MKPLQRVQANPSNAILVVIDMQKERNMRGGPSTDEPNPHLSTREAIVPAVRGLVDRAHDAGVQVVYLQSVRNHLEPEFTIFEYNHILKIGTWNSEFIDELTPLPQDIIVRKWCHDPWHETDLERVLMGLVPDPTRCQALITGGGALGCAFFGAMGFYVRNYWTVLVLDGMYGGPVSTANYFSRTHYPTYPNVLVSRSDLIEFSPAREPLKPALAFSR